MFLIAFLKDITLYKKKWTHCKLGWISRVEDFGCERPMSYLEVWFYWGSPNIEPRRCCIAIICLQFPSLPEGALYRVWHCEGINVESFFAAATVFLSISMKPSCFHPTLDHKLLVPPVALHKHFILFSSLFPDWYWIDLCWFDFTWSDARLDFFFFYFQNRLPIPPQPPDWFWCERLIP